MASRQNLAKLRDIMKKHRLDAYLVPSSDPHQSEYLPKAWKRRHFITGFTGSAGNAAITQKSGALWTDSRYFLQASIELRGSGIQLMKLGVPGTPSIPKWLSLQLKKGARIGFDPQLISQSQYESLSKEFAELKLEFVRIKANLIDKVWQDQPSVPMFPIECHPTNYAGETLSSKLNRLRKELKKNGANVHVIASLDMIAWLFNIRGKDIEFNPLAVAYALVTDSKAYLFTHPRKVTPALKRALGKQVEIRHYDSFESALRRIGSRSIVWIDKNSTSRWIVEAVPPAVRRIYCDTPILLMRAQKNTVEIRGAAKAHIRDGVAMCRFLHWLEENVSSGNVNEINAAEVLAGFRAKSQLYRGDSFDPIFGYGEHGAIIHYSAKLETCSKIRAHGLLLIDTGGQYADGTTDITRTICMGAPTSEQKNHFTRVLKGHIGIVTSIFPAGTTGGQIDAFARRALWEGGFNYGHGTGHGVGSYLGVHEGPQRIAPGAHGTPLQPGMIISNEPGSYLAGRFGIRIENLIYVTQDKERSSSDNTFYRFENLTICPIDTRLINKRLMTPDEIRYLNQYHAMVRKKLLPYLKGPAAKWLNARREQFRIALARKNKRTLAECPFVIPINPV
jgi:Xaa-Pro aminopeptidase